VVGRVDIRDVNQMPSRTWVPPPPPPRRETARDLPWADRAAQWKNAMLDKAGANRPPRNRSRFPKGHRDRATHQPMIRLRHRVRINGRL
jgi:hypothetical protein